MLVGNLPKDLGLIDLSPTEMMFWLYCPIKLAASHKKFIPDNLKQFLPLVDSVFKDIKENETWIDEFHNLWYGSYVYITAKTLYVSGENTGQRPGWHSDGFKTDDLNYIWYDSCPTEFIESDPFEVSNDCNESMIQFENHPGKCYPKLYPVKHLLKLDQTVIHRPAPYMEPGMRTFVKISVSKNRYNLIGNSINHLIPSFGYYGDNFAPFVPRDETRNHPCRDFE